MAEQGALEVKRKLFYYDVSDSENGDIMDSNDRVKDNGYVESENTSVSLLRICHIR